MASQLDGAFHAEQALIDVSIEGWRLCRLFERVLGKLDAGEATRYANQVRYFQKNLEDYLLSGGFKLVNLEGLPYDAGMAVSALNMEDFASDDTLVVDRMVEPIVMGPNGVRKTGTVMLRKAQE